MMIDILDVQKDASLLNDFLVENQNLVYHLLCKYFPNVYYSDNRDDMVQEAFIYLLKNIKSYDASKGNVGTYLSKGIMLGAYGYLASQRKYSKAECISINTPINDDGDTLEYVLSSSDDIYDNVCDRLDTIGKFNAFFNNLFPRDKTLLELKARNKTQREIADALGISQTQVNKDINTLYKRYQRYNAGQTKISERRRNNMDSYDGKLYVLDGLKLVKREAMELLARHGFLKSEAEEYLMLLRKDRTNLKSAI